MATRAQQIAARVFRQMKPAGSKKPERGKGKDPRYKDFARELMESVKAGDEDRLAQTLEELKGL